jgi:uncharacterized glyoxalase superfamily protein PhnB
MSAVVYRDPKAAPEFLEAAFGFELFMLIEDDQEAWSIRDALRRCAIMIGYDGATSTRARPPSAARSPSRCTSSPADVDAHCERARAAGWRS